jgi:hypothetical protein
MPDQAEEGQLSTPVPTAPSEPAAENCIAANAPISPPQTTKGPESSLCSFQPAICLEIVTMTTTDLLPGDLPREVAEEGIWEACPTLSDRPMDMGAGSAEVW